MQTELQRAWTTKKLRHFFLRGSLLAVLFCIGLQSSAFAFLPGNTDNPPPPPPPVADEPPPTTEDRAKELLESMRTLAGVLLVAALIISAIAASFGQYKLTIGVVMGGLVLYGTVWFLGMIVDAAGPDIDTPFTDTDLNIPPGD